MGIILFVLGLVFVAVVVVLVIDIHHSITCVDKSVPLQSVKKEERRVLSYLMTVGTTRVPIYKTQHGYVATYENGKTNFYIEKKDIEKFTCSH